ncbi:MAG: hypothetical protein JNL57_03360 [Bacteroidetes bacterium]|nr:hypothetical protein [Bacteroidota bacterium]
MKTVSFTIALSVFTQTLLLAGPVQPLKIKTNPPPATPWRYDFGIGYSFPSQRTDFGDKTSWNGAKLESRENVYGSYGTGATVSARANYFFDPCFGLSAGVQHTFGARQLEDQYSLNTGYLEKSELKSGLTGLSMEAVTRTCCEGDWHGEARFGTTFYPGGNIRYYETRGTNGAVDYDIQSTTRLRPGFGFNAGFGGDYQVSSGFNIGFDIRTQFYSATGKSWEYTRFDDKGNDNLQSMKVADKQFEYLKELNENTNTPGNSGYDNSKPREVLSPRYPFNSVIGTIRTRFTF